MEILKQILAKNKAFDVIDSCENWKQFANAEKYIELYYNMFNDFSGKAELNRYLKDKKIKSLK